MSDATPPPPSSIEPPPPMGAAADTAAPPQPTYVVPPPVAPATGRGPLPIVAISLAGLALLTAFSAPGITWAIAIAAIVLGIIGLVKKLQPAILSILALAIGPVAWIIAIIVAFAGFAAGIREGSGDLDGDERPVAGQPLETEQPEQDPEPVADGRSLDTPLPFGSVVSVDGWAGKFDVSFGAIVWDANAIVEAENMFNSDPSDGMKYIMLPVTITNTDDEEWSASGTFFWGDIKLVSAGRGFSEGAIVVVPDDLSSQGDLYPGGTATGNVVFEVPIEVTSGTWDAAGVFVAAQ